MHDLNYFRNHLDVFADMAKKRGITLDLDAFRTLDKERRELITANEPRKAQPQQDQRRNRTARKRSRTPMR
jgi:seryl-tRNA synthetase